MFCTEDHNAERASEAERVQREGGKLHHAEVYGGGGAGGNAAGPVVGGDVRVYPNCFTLEEARAKALTLNMSRSLGHIKLGQGPMLMQRVSQGEDTKRGRNAANWDLTLCRSCMWCLFCCVRLAWCVR
jgi:hypothetical protein